MKDTENSPGSPTPVGTDTGAPAHRNTASDHASGRTGIDDDTTVNDFSSATTEHLRRLWMAGARDIIVTYDADAVRHRTYLSHPRTDI